MCDRPLVLHGQEFGLTRPAVMSIVNLTPDSFYSGARYESVDKAVRAAQRQIELGADIVDVGAVRAGQEGDWVDLETEVRRLVPFFEAFRERCPDAIISVDTWRSGVVEALEPYRVDLVNDTWQGHDPELVHVAATVNAGYVCSHTGGLPPRTDPIDVTYPPEPTGVINDTAAILRSGAEVALRAGIPPERILVDPTLDFGKTTQHSLTLLRATEAIAGLGFPVLQAVSRKDFIGESLDRGVADRLSGTLAATAVASWLGAVAFRSHDVAETRDVVDMVSVIAGRVAPKRRVRGVSSSH